MIPFLDLKAQYRSIEAEIRAAVLETLDSGHFVLGPAVAAFERDFAAYCGAPHAIAVNSGTSALHMALVALGIGPGDEVVTTPMTFVATVSAIQYAGARPVLVDADPETWTLDPARLEAAITPRTKAIMPVHLHGRPADMDGIAAIAARHGVPVIEDAAQAHGADYRGRRIGSISPLTCFSFYPGKNLGAYGEGGAVVTADDDLAKTLRMLRDWGQSEKYLHVLKGFNTRMDGVQGAVLGVKLPYLDGWTEARRRWARRYDAALAGSGIATPPDDDRDRHVYHVYAVRVPERDAVRRILNERGVQTGIHYPIPVHLQPAFKDLGYGPGSFPVTERIAAETLSLPLFPEMTAEQVDEAAAALIAAVEEVRVQVPGI